MTVLDYIIIGVVVFSAVAGVLRGLLREVCSLVTWILAFWLAWRLGPSLEPHLGGALFRGRTPLGCPRSHFHPGADGGRRRRRAGLAPGSPVPFSGLDRLLGFLLGVVRGLVILGVAAMICHAVRLDDEAWWRGSRLAPYVEAVANVLRSMAGETWVERATSRFR